MSMILLLMLPASSSECLCDSTVSVRLSGDVERYLLLLCKAYCMLTPAYIENSCQADIKIHHSAYLSMFKRWSMHYLLQCVCYVVFVLVSMWCMSYYKPSVLWRCWLGGRKGIRPIKNWVVGCWRGMLERGANLHIAQRMPLPLTVSRFSKIQIGFSFLVPAHLGNPRKIVVKRVCVCDVCPISCRPQLV